jgi:hypothetical protein
VWGDAADKLLRRASLYWAIILASGAAAVVEPDLRCVVKGWNYLSRPM